MIVVQLLGGLGNQIFQYALGRRLAHDYGVPLKLDISAFTRYTLRSYRLNAFNTVHDLATTADMWRLPALPSMYFNALETRLGRGVSLLRRQRKVICETEYHFYAPVLDAGANVYLQGYWQNERYFKSIGGILREELTLKTPLEGRSRQIAQSMRDTASVSLHIRRGDYATNAATREAHGLLSLTYYQTAIARLVTTVPDPHFFIFSDDPQWARDNLKLDYPTELMDFNSADRDYEDLFLMTHCKHHIVANSSFSWWGAWLAAWPEKQVYAPKHWFRQPPLDQYEIIPPSWTQLNEG